MLPGRHGGAQAGSQAARPAGDRAALPARPHDRVARRERDADVHLPGDECNEPGNPSDVVPGLSREVRHVAGHSGRRAGP